MIEAKQFNHLRVRAETILQEHKSKRAPIQEVYSLVEELNLAQIELELQNEDLIKTQVELQLSHDEYSNLYNLSPVAYFTCNIDGLIIDVNQVGCDFLGMKKHSLLNRCFSRFIEPEFQLLFSQHRLMALSGNIPQTCEVKIVRWNGPALDAQLDCKPIQNCRLQQKTLLICLTNISDQKSNEKYLHSQRAKTSSIDKLYSLNEQIYSVSLKQNHSLTILNNYINGCIRRVQSEKYCTEDLLDILQKMCLQTQTIAEDIQSINEVYSNSYFYYEVANMNSIIADALSLIRYEISDYPVKIIFDPIDNYPLVKLDVMHIQQVIQNLTRNSIESMRDAKVKEPKLFVDLSLSEENYVEINIIDNGPGFNLANIDNFFKPNISTKEYAIGLGLTVSRKIIEKHGGRLTAHQNFPNGAHLTILLPCAVSEGTPLLP